MSLKIIKQEAKISEFENEKLKLEKKQQNTVILIISIALILIAIGIVFLYRLYRQKNKYNELLLVKNQEINQQKEEIETQRDGLEKSNIIIEHKNKAITQSINYAQHIQSAMLSRKDKLRRFIPQAFILYRPRDIVSGDFYWYAKIENKIFVIISDCTGHGVPGAFISMTGSNLLSNIIESNNIHEPSEILAELDKGIIEALNQKHSENQDGMDISICVIDTEKEHIEYSGAKSPLIVIENNQLSYLKPNKSSIGGVRPQRRNKPAPKKTFETQTIDYTGKNISIYMFSDGIIDQFDKNNEKKFTRNRLKNILLQIQNQTMQQQENKLNNTLNNWQGNNSQTDDITIIGFSMISQKK